MMIRNPKAKWWRVLGVTRADMQRIRDAVEAHLDANDDKEEIDDAVIRDLDPLLSDERVWSEVKKALAVR